VRASIAAEKAGVPAVPIVASGFLTQGRAFARALGMPNLAIAEYPGVIMTHAEDELQKHVADTLVPNIVKGLTVPIATAVKAAEPGPEDIVFSGTLDEVTEHFLAEQWTDGLPVIPPTLERVRSFLRFTGRKPDEILGILAPDNREATIWNVAVNGVMAGCRPEYMPILAAIVEAIAEPVFHLRDAGATPGWEPLIVLNGPIVKQLDFNYETGVMRVGRQANTSIGRFLRLYMRNVAGLRIAPGNTDKGSIALGFNVVLAENEEAVAGLGWNNFAADRGFANDENVVTVQSAIGMTVPLYSAGETALRHMETLVDVFGRTCSFWTHTAARKGQFHPLLMISPVVASILARDGWTKDDVRRHLYENARVSVRALERQAWDIGFSSFDLADYVAKGIISKEFHESDDPDRLVPVFIRPEWIGIVVSGDPGRNQNKGFVENHDQGPPVSKRIVLPGNWDALLQERRKGK
jgi:hypothetical protein